MDTAATAEAASGAPPRHATPPSSGANRRQEALTDGAPTPFDPLPAGYTPPRSCEAAFIALCPATSQPAAATAAWAQLATAIAFEARRVLDDVGAARGQSLDEVFAVTAYTADARAANAVFREDDNVYYRLNEILRKRDVGRFAPFADYFSYLRSALGKIPPQTTTVWRGIKGVTLEELGKRYKEGRELCLVSFTSVTTDASVMQDFAGAAGGVMLKVRATEALSIAEYSLFPDENELLLAPNALLRVDTALSAAQAADVASFPGGASLPSGVALIAATQQPTPVPVVTVTLQHRTGWCVPRDATAGSVRTHLTENRHVCAVSFARGGGSDDVVGIVAQHCPQLTTLDVSNTGGKVTDASIAAVAQRCPQLTLLLVSAGAVASTASIVHRMLPHCRVRAAGF